MQSFEAISKEMLITSEVVYITSDGVTFLDFNFAKKHAGVKGLELFTFKREAAEAAPENKKKKQTRKA